MLLAGYVLDASNPFEFPCFQTSHDPVSDYLNIAVGGQMICSAASTMIGYLLPESSVIAGEHG